ncbi:hypothetical protein [Staphylococcus phage SAP6]|nr:hypothetical protein [Staphylococcus phage StAP1]WAW12203.1 hypothetical protein [Staphylococcus phage SAP6]
MKLKIKDNQFASLTVNYTNNAKLHIDSIPVSTLVDWYPLSNAYEYKASNDFGYIELKRLRSSLPMSYGLTHRTLYKCETVKCKLGLWYNEKIKEDNEKIIEKAKLYGLPTIDEPFTSKDVKQGFSDLGVIFQTLKTISTNEYLKDKTIEEINTFSKKSEDYQLNEVLKYSTTLVDDTYSDLSQIYNMLLLMKKIVSI